MASSAIEMAQFWYASGRVGMSLMASLAIATASSCSPILPKLSNRIERIEWNGSKPPSIQSIGESWWLVHYTVDNVALT